MNYSIFLFKTVLEDFKRNKTRTFLASLGIMIGVLSVVMLIALGLGLKNYIQQQFESMGSNLIIVMPGSELGEGGLQSFSTSFTSGMRFDERDIISLQRIRELDYVVPAFSRSTIVEANGKEVLASVMGTNGEMFELMDVKAEYGRVFSVSEGEKRIKDVVLGSFVAEDLFGDKQYAVGKRVRISNQRYQVIGVSESKGDPDVDRGIIMPYKTTFGSLNPDKEFYTIMLGVNSEDMIPEAKSRVEEVLTKRYDEDEFSVSEQSELLDVVNQIFGMINMVLVAIGSISLVVGGIGIMNIMYANVTERIKEIGIRRALGATRRDILYQFLSESLLLSLFGGLLGIVIASLIVFVVRPFFPLEINLFSVILAVGISSGIGIFFGVFPARKASKLTPIDAIRYE